METMIQLLISILLLVSAIVNLFGRVAYYGVEHRNATFFIRVVALVLFGTICYILGGQ